MAMKMLSDTERLLTKREVDSNGCWNYTGHISYNGYGQFSVGSRTSGNRRMASSHRTAYELLVGPIPEGHQVDHTCRNRKCFNPEHLEAVTAQENIARSVPYRDRASYGARRRALTRCKKGHPLEIVGTNRNGSPMRGCKTCRSETARAWQKMNKPGREK